MVKTRKIIVKSNGNEGIIMAMAMAKIIIAKLIKIMLKSMRKKKLVIV